MSMSVSKFEKNRGRHHAPELSSYSLEWVVSTTGQQDRIYRKVDPLLNCRTKERKKKMNEMESLTNERLRSEGKFLRKKENG